MITDYYKLLGLGMDAEPGEIRAAYRRRKAELLELKDFPEDNDPADIERRLIHLDEAIQTLGFPESRIAYNAQLMFEGYLELLSGGDYDERLMVLEGTAIVDYYADHGLAGWLARISNDERVPGDVRNDAARYCSYEEDDIPGYYAVLGVTPDATAEEIEAAYSAFVSQSNFSLAQYDDDSEEARALHEAMAEAEVAYTVLSDPDSRMAYDSHVSVFGELDTGDTVYPPEAPEESEEGFYCPVRLDDNDQYADLIRRTGDRSVPESARDGPGGQLTDSLGKKGHWKGLIVLAYGPAVPSAVRASAYRNLPQALRPLYRSLSSNKDDLLAAHEASLELTASKDLGQGLRATIGVEMCRVYFDFKLWDLLADFAGRADCPSEVKNFACGKVAELTSSIRKNMALPDGFVDTLKQMLSNKFIDESVRIHSGNKVVLALLQGNWKDEAAELSDHDGIPTEVKSTHYKLLCQVETSGTQSLHPDRTHMVRRQMAQKRRQPSPEPPPRRTPPKLKK